MQIYNTRNLDTNTRFLLSILAGFVAAIIGGILYGLLSSAVHVEMAVVYVFIGWCIGNVIRTVGRGVHVKFSIVGAIMTTLAIFIGDSIANSGFALAFDMMTNLTGLSFLIKIWLGNLLSTDLVNLLRLLLRLVGIYFGYQYSRVL